VHPPANSTPLLKRLGPGLITGAADDDPSGIATYSQAGAQYGYGLLWSVLLTTPLMIGIQIVSARIGRVTGHGLAANIRDHFPPWLLHGIVGLLVVANTINIAADIGAMGNALQLLLGGRASVYTLLFALVSLVLQIFVPFPRYAPILKWLTLSLLGYVAALMAISVPWEEVRAGAFVPHAEFKPEYIATLVAVLGTTISPYLFFWQASQEVEEQRAAPGHEPLRDAPHQADEHLERIKVDTWIGMTFSNVIALCIMVTTAATLHTGGPVTITSAEQAAEALRPVAGNFAFVLFSLSIIDTGLLAVPVLAGSAAYAVAESRRWPIGLGLPLLEARGFYMVIAAATLIGVALDFAGIDPIQALIFSAVVNGVIAVPIMAVMMRLATMREVMGPFVVKRRLLVLGWLSTGVMAAAVAAMFATL
jgi:NRAMP (natural resistance-associated macrophage protein)-like metal ion transporter